jgi:catechol 2,3-dioxygenase-like lactoylglutathione lyase family enzyme
MSNLISGSLQAVTIVTNTWEQSRRFYGSALGYQVLAEGELSDAQKAMFGEKLGRYCLFGFAQGALVRLIELDDKDALPVRLGANPWDNGLAVLEAGTPDVQAAYFRVLRHRFGAICVPTEFSVSGPEPLGTILIRSTGFMGPSGEQLFVSQIVEREGGVSLLNEKAVDGINAPANVVISLKNREPIGKFWLPLFGIAPVTDLPLVQKAAAEIMGGPAGMGFDMTLNGHGSHRVGLEMHVFEPYNPDYQYKTYPCDFSKTGLASACWQSPDLAAVKAKIEASGYRIISQVGLPLRHNPNPEAVVVVGEVGEIIELVQE